MGSYKKFKSWQFGNSSLQLSPKGGEGNRPLSLGERARERAAGMTNYQG